jgi:hypothetical protein
MFKKLGSPHVLAAFAQVDFGPILEARCLCGGWSLQTGGLPPQPPLDLLLADDGIGSGALVGRAGVAAPLEPEVELPDVTAFPEAHARFFLRSYPAHAWLVIPRWVHSGCALPRCQGGVTRGPHGP